MAREEFPKTVLKTLSARVSHRCSDPGCGVPTSAPGAGPDGVISIGVGAHIHAASPGGPRYLVGMTKAERISINNAIWLCVGCSTKIDRDVLRYPAELLRAWKEEAEKRATNELGRPLPKATDAVDQLTTALTRLPTSFAPTAIQNVHIASSQALEQVDPRFRVETSFDANGTRISLHAKETVPFSFSVSQEAGPEWRERLRAMVDHGTPAVLASEGVQLSGSELFEKALPQSGQWVLTPHGKQAVIKLSLVEKSTDLQLASLDDLHGELVGGRVSFTVRARGMSGLLEVSVQARHAAMEEPADFTIGVDLTSWVGKPVLSLPYFDKIHQIYASASHGLALHMRSEIDGDQLLSGRLTLPADDLQIKATLNFLDYTRRARVLSAHLKTPIQFQLVPGFSTNDHVALAEIVDIIEGKQNVDASAIRSNIQTLLEVDEGGENMRLLENWSAPGPLRHVQPAVEPLVVFGQPIVLPDLETLLSEALPKILRVTTSESGSQTMVVEWQPVEGSRVTRVLEFATRPSRGP